MSLTPDYDYVGLISFIYSIKRKGFGGCMWGCGDEKLRGWMRVTGSCSLQIDYPLHPGIRAFFF